MVVAAVLVVAAALEAWLPLRLEVPFSRRHAPLILAEGSISFDGSAALLSDPADPPAWLRGLDPDEPFTVHLRAASADPDQQGPARLLALSASVYSADIVVGQEGERLTVRLRHPGTDWRGEPALDGGPVFANTAAHDIDLRVDGHTAELRVDGELRDRVETDAAVMSQWERSHLLALGDEYHGDRAWQGTLSEAVVQGDDLLRSDTLHPAAGVVGGSRLAAFWRVVPADHPSITVARFVAFALLGLAAPRRRGAIVGLVALPFVLTVGKLFVANRDPVLADALVGATAVLLGIAVQPGLGRSLPFLRPALARLQR